MTVPTNNSSSSLILAAANVPEDQRHILLSAALRESTREALVACNDCVLGESTSRVPWEGPSSPIFLLGEAPGADEERTGRPFIGRAGVLLDSCISDAGLKRSELAVGNTIGCRPPRNNYGEAESVNAPDLCRRHVLSAIDAAQSWIVVLLGGSAIRWARPDAKSVSGLRGRLWWDAGILYAATFHPAYALRTRSARDHITEDLAAVARIVALEQEAPPVTDWSQSSTSKLMPAKDRETMRLHYNRRGWVVLRAGLIGRQIAIVKNDHTRIPVPWDTLPRYTLAEMNRLIPDPEMFRVVNVIKEAGLGGQIL